MTRNSLSGVSEELQGIAARDIGEEWQEWSDALRALSTGLGRKEARFNEYADASLYIASIGGWYMELTEVAWEHMSGSLSPFLERVGYVVDPSGVPGQFDEENTESDVVKMAIGDSYRIPLMRSVADVISPSLEQDYSLTGGEYIPLGHKTVDSSFLLATSSQGIWRVPKDGSFLYWSSWQQVLSTKLYRNVRMSAGGFDTDNHIHCVLLTLPQRSNQLYPFNQWRTTAQVIDQVLSIRGETGSILNEEDASVIMNGLENPNLILGFDRAEFFTISPSDGSRFETAIKDFGSEVSEEEREVQLKKVDGFIELIDLGLESLINSDLNQEEWLKENFDCGVCGGIANTQELVDLFRSELSQFTDRLPGEVSVVAIVSTIAGSIDPKKVKPALLQREYGLDYDIAVEILDVAKRLGFGGDASCAACIGRKSSKKSAGSAVYEREALPPSIRFAVLQRDGFRCRYCGKGTQSNPPVELEVDHLVPVAAGGDNDLGNLVSACVSCNRGKSASPVL